MWCAWCGGGEQDDVVVLLICCCIKYIMPPGMMFFYDSIPLNISGYNLIILHHFKTKSRQDTNTFIIILLPFCHILYRIKLGRGKKQKQIKQNNK